MHVSDRRVGFAFTSIREAVKHNVILPKSKVKSSPIYNLPGEDRDAGERAGRGIQGLAGGGGPDAKCFVRGGRADALAIWRI